MILENIFHRQLAIYNPVENSQLPVTIVGAGMIGSTAAILLAKLGIMNIKIYDGDHLEEHNWPNQFYPKSAIGKNKVKVLGDVLNEWTYSNVDTRPEFWDGEDFEGIVISAVDSIDMRKKIWANCKMRPKVKLYVDGRIGGQQISVYSIDPVDYDDAKFYDDTLKNKAEELPCTERGVIDVSFFCASFITRAIREYLVNKKNLYRCVVFDASEVEMVKYSNNVS